MIGSLSVVFAHLILNIFTIFIFRNIILLLGWYILKFVQNQNCSFKNLRIESTLFLFRYFIAKYIFLDEIFKHKLYCRQ